jgi:hypothetical protein
MATIVKTNYRNAQNGGLQSALGSIAYYSHRQDIDGERVSRSGFSRDQDGLDVETMGSLIQGNDGQLFYRMVLSPGAEKDTDVNLKDWTRDMMLELEQNHGDFPYVAIEHRDQTDYAHIHVVMVLDKKLDREDLNNLRDVGSELYDMRREWYEPSLTQTREPEKHLAREFVEYSEGYIASYNDEPDEPSRHIRQDKSKSLDR